jgi:hypothetical protein
VATYLLAPGLFADRIRAASLAAGAAAVSGPLGAAPEVADVLLQRYAEARTIPVLQNGTVLQNGPGAPPPGSPAWPLATRVSARS